MARGVALLVQLVVGSDVPRGINLNDLFQLRFILVPGSPRACKRPTSWFANSRHLIDRTAASRYLLAMSESSKE